MNSDPNSDPNSDSKQCPESKLGWVHRVHTQGPSCAPTAPRLWAQCRVVACTGAISWLCPAVSQAMSCAHAAVSSPPPVIIKNLYRDPNLCRAHCAPCCTRCRLFRRAPVLCRRALLRCIVALVGLCRDARPTPPFTIQMIVLQHTPLARPRACALPHTLARALTHAPCARAGLVVGPCRRAVGRVVAPYCTPLLSCVTIQFAIS